MKVDELLAQWPGEAFRDAALAPYTTFRIGGPADVLLVARSSKELGAAVLLARDAGLPWRVLGRGSNVLIADAGFRGVVILDRSRGVRVKMEDEAAVLRVASGELLSELADRASSAGWAGLEWAAGIPGTIGGAVVGNAGAFGSSMAQVVSWVRVFRESGRARRLRPDKLAFDYRHSRFRKKAGQEAILEVGLRLPMGEPSILKAQMVKYRRWRRQRQPRGSSAGSVFRNPHGDAAGRLIEQAGMKGKRWGQAQVSVKHANFFLNLGGARAADMRALIEETRQAVRRTAGLELALEIELVGAWEETPTLPQDDSSITPEMVGHTAGLSSNCDADS
jgi:UDP-N-acetylmuramate dehydrogenase